MLIAVAPVGVSTADAYAAVDGARGEPEPRGPVVLDVDALATWGGIGRLGGNDFEPTIFGKEPAIRETFVRVAETHPLAVRMSGSGSAVFAIYRTDGARADAQMLLARPDQQLIATRTRRTPAPAPSDLP